MLSAFEIYTDKDMANMAADASTPLGDIFLMPTILTIAPITNNNIMYLENDINTLHINMIVNAVLSFLFKKSNISPLYKIKYNAKQTI